MSQSAGSGRYNDRAGRAWERECAAWLRAHGWPHAEQLPRGTLRDLGGTGDVSVECTVQPWDRITVKLDQAAQAATARGRDEWWIVWKRRKGTTDPAWSYVVTSAGVFWAMALRLEELERVVAVERDEYGRGYRDGVAGRAAEEARA